MTQKKSDDAVSPVVGVMLMIVITVVIAGVIAAFGTGMVGNVESAPNVILDVKIISNFESLDRNDQPGMLSGPDFQIVHVSGDPLDTGDIEIQMDWIASDGAHHSTYSAAENKARGNIALMCVKTDVPYLGYDYEYLSGADRYNFGDVILNPGFRLFAHSDGLDRVTNGGKNIGSPWMDKIFNNGKDMGGSATNKGVMQYLSPGTPVEITILHIPSNTIIYEKEVVVQ